MDAAAAVGTATSAAATASTRVHERTNPPSARGSVQWREAGLLTRGTPHAAFPALGPVASWREASPLTAAGPSRTSTGFPYRSPVCRASLASGLVSDS